MIPEAVRKLQEHAFNDLGINVMWCGYYDGNEKSRKCQEKCGFTFHHTEKDKPCELMGDARTEHFTKITKKQWQENNSKKDIVVYVHGKGGNAGEAEHYKKFFKEDVYGFDYKSENPWDAKAEFTAKFKELSDKYNRITLIANSIGAYFSMNSGIDKFIHKAYFISPIVSLERLILNMIEWAGATEQELEEKKIIPVDFGDDLSWDYLQYVRNHKISWTVPTDILYASCDNLQSLDTIKEFCSKASATLTVMDGGEHWFHTKEQMEFLDEWIGNK